MLTLRRVLVVATFAVVAPTLHSSPAHASCAAPEIDVSPDAAAPSGAIHVSGRYFAAECNDTPQVGGSAAPGSPQRGIRVIFQQGERETELGVIDASPDSTFDLDAAIPSDASEGGARVAASAPDHVAATAEITVTSPPNSSGSTPQLARTGEPSRVIASTAVVALALGIGMLLIAAHRRR